MMISSVIELGLVTKYTLQYCAGFFVFFEASVEGGYANVSLTETATKKKAKKTSKIVKIISLQALIIRFQRAQKNFLSPDCRNSFPSGPC